ncbi:hypothetical protein [Nocardia sputi]|nr:hypothetical protein [Nocardia sputi]
MDAWPVGGASAITNMFSCRARLGFGMDAAYGIAILLAAMSG